MSASMGQGPPGKPPRPADGLASLAQWSQNTTVWCVPGSRRREWQVSPLLVGRLQGASPASSKPTSTGRSRGRSLFQPCSSSCFSLSSFLMAMSGQSAPQQRSRPWRCRPGSPLGFPFACFCCHCPAESRDHAATHARSALTTLPSLLPSLLPHSRPSALKASAHVRGTRGSLPVSGFSHLAR